MSALFEIVTLLLFKSNKNVNLTFYWANVNGFFFLGYVCVCVNSVPDLALAFASCQQFSRQVCQRRPVNLIHTCCASPFSFPLLLTLLLYSNWLYNHLYLLVIFSSDYNVLSWVQLLHNWWSLKNHQLSSIKCLLNRLWFSFINIYYKHTHTHTHTRETHWAKVNQDQNLNKI